MAKAIRLPAPHYPAAIVAVDGTQIQEVAGGFTVVRGPVAVLHPACAAAANTRVLQVLPHAERDWTCTRCGQLIDKTLLN